MQRYAKLFSYKALLRLVHPPPFTDGVGVCRFLAAEFGIDFEIRERFGAIAAIGTLDELSTFQQRLEQLRANFNTPPHRRPY